MMHRLRMFSTLALALALPLTVAVGCTDPCGDDECLFTGTQWDVAQSLSPLPALPPDRTNKYREDPRAQVLGQKLFFETRYSGKLKVGTLGSNGGLGEVNETGKVACASCHIGDTWFMDSRSYPGNVSLGTGYTSRNAPSLVNVAFYQRNGLAGRQDTLWNQSSTSPESGDNTSGDRCDYARMLAKYYREPYDSIFNEFPLPTELSTTTPSRFPLKCKPKSTSSAPDGAWERMPEEDQDVILRVMANQGKAVAAYESLLISRNAPFDKFMAGDVSAISDDAKRGLDLFIGKAACVDCHNGPFFSDQGYHNLGVPQLGENVPAEDTGRYSDIERFLKHPLTTASKYTDDPSDNRRDGVVLEDSVKGQFRTPTLRQIAKTGPYFHTGGIRTLTEVVEFYNDGGGTTGFVGTKDPRIRPLGLTGAEIAELVAFLETLTGEEVPEDLRHDIRAMP